MISRRLLLKRCGLGLTAAAEHVLPPWVMTSRGAESYSSTVLSGGLLIMEFHCPKWKPAVAFWDSLVVRPVLECLSLWMVFVTSAVCLIESFEKTGD
ncbi:MAG: hypothetical protein NW701_05960 [Nitrospira sp.]